MWPGSDMGWLYASEVCVISRGRGGKEVWAHFDDTDADVDVMRGTAAVLPRRVVVAQSLGGLARLERELGKGEVCELSRSGQPFLQIRSSRRIV
jgi:hypothetical protein